jgi:hypothetical protein
MPSARLVSDSHSVHRDASRQRVQCWSVYSPRSVARSARALSSGDPGFRCIVRQDYAFLDGCNCVAAPYSFEPNLGLACISYSSTFHCNAAVACNNCFQSPWAGAHQRPGESLGYPEASSGLARTKTALGPPQCNSGGRHRVSVSRADSELQESCDEIIDERRTHTRKH